MKRKRWSGDAEPSFSSAGCRSGRERADTGALDSGTRTRSRGPSGCEAAGLRGGRRGAIPCR